MHALIIILIITLSLGFSQPQAASEDVETLIEEDVMNLPLVGQGFYGDQMPVVDDDDEEPIRGFDPIRHTVFRLYTLSNNRRGSVIRIGNKDSLMNSSFNVSNPTRFIIHDWNNDADSPMTFLIRDAYLDKADYNIFVVDWDLGSFGPYITVRQRSIRVGKVLGYFINFLQNEKKINSSDIYLVGYGLGAHIAGIAGKTMTNGKPGALFALDPVILRFGSVSPATVLSQDDANYVEAIHTSVLTSMLQQPLGHADFYVGYGGPQPGCGINFISCSHERSYLYFAESIRTKRGFFGVPCTNVRDIVGRRTCRRARLPISTMGGEFANTNNTGVYYVPVSAFPPFAQGRVEIL